MKTWTNTDKSKWPLRGEWDDEPDKAHWVDEKTGLDCLIVRNNGGALCGYVGLPQSHPMFGMGYDDVSVYDFDDESKYFPRVHGGLTFADRCSPSEDESKHICHPKEGAANEVVWWFGFDCAHSGDLCPAYTNFGGYESYKTFDYVKHEVESLARQFASKSGLQPPNTES